MYLLLSKDWTSKGPNLGLAGMIVWKSPLPVGL